LLRLKALYTAVKSTVYWPDQKGSIWSGKTFNQSNARVTTTTREFTWEGNTISKRKEKHKSYIIRKTGGGIVKYVNTLD